MNPLPRRSPLSILLLLMLSMAGGARGNEVDLPRGAGARSEGEKGRKYAPDRQVDVRHLKLEVTPDFTERTVRGTATLTFTPISRPVERLVLDAVDLAIDEIRGKPEVRNVYAGPETLEITFSRMLEPGEEGQVSIVYSAEPKKGLYFRTPELGYPADDAHLWTQGETHEARYWYPGVDYPNERFTSEVVCHVPAGMVAISNGRLVGREAGEDGLVAWRWLQDKSHPNYLVALVAGNLVAVKDRYGDIPMAFWTPPSRAHLAGRAFRETPRIMAFLENEIGVDFPWAKYDQAAVQDYLYGGMENTTLTILTDGILYPPEVGNVRESTGLVAHELAHQWFGDYVTCKDWSHVWLNEGFATYYTWLYKGERDGEAAMHYALWGAAEGIARRTKDTRPIVEREYERAFEQFSFRAYQKGAWVLHMLREALGEDVYRRGIGLYLERNALGSVVTKDLSQALEDVSGQSLDRFFDQWVYHAGIPRLEVRYHWNGATRQARLTVRQTQEISENALVFDAPLAVRFSGEGWSHEATFRIRDREEDFYLSLEKMPRVVHVNSRQSLLAEISFNPGRTMLLAQLNDEDDALARVKAARALAEHEDAAVAKALGNALGADPFYGVRLEAAKSLARMGTEAGKTELMKHRKAEDDRVRLAVVGALSEFYDRDVGEALQEVIGSETNPYILASAIRGAGRYPDEAIAGLLKEKLHADSHQQKVALAAMETARDRDAGGMTEELLQVLKGDHSRFPHGAYARALEILGFLARDGAERQAVREFLTGELDSPVESVQAGALRGLGELGDPAALATVQGFTGEAHAEEAQKAAREAAERLRSETPTEPRLQELRREVLELKEETGRLGDKIETLEKRFEAGKAEPAEAEERRRFLGIF